MATGKSFTVRSRFGGLLTGVAAGGGMLLATQAVAQTVESQDRAVTGVEDIVVTAQKRSESSLDVPMGLTAVTGEQLQAEQSFRLEDLLGKVPGMHISDSLGTQLVVRGIASSATSVNAPVATYIDDTPLVGVGAFSGGYANTPNLDTFDLDRIEVLKGPQGTLYGASALGGLLKYVTKAPDPSGYAAKLHAGLSSVRFGNGLGHNLRGMINVPLGEDLALRVVGYHSRYQGFIDNPLLGKEDINGSRTYGGRATLLWRPSADLSFRLSILDQQRRADGIAVVPVNANTLNPISCQFCQPRDIDQPTESRLRMYNLTVNWGLGGIDLTSSSTFDRWRYLQGQSVPGVNATADALKGVPGSGRWGILIDNDFYGDDFVHETRLASDNAGFFNWQAGVYYTRKEATNDQRYLPVNRITKTLETVEFGGSKQPTTYRELAAFGNLNFKLSPEFDVSLGSRVSDQAQTFSQTGRLVAPSLPEAKMDDTVFTFSGDARWHLTPQAMVYARIASGFVPGGPNIAPLTGTTVPPTYDSSTTVNYELGFKGKLLDNKMTLELAAFQIDWKRIQVYQVIGIYTTLSNGGTAVSRGLEWAVNVVPTQGLTLGVSGSYTDAHLTQDTPAATGGRNGDRLPVTPRWQGNLSADYTWPMFGVDGFVGADWRYIGDRFADFRPVDRQHMPAYDLIDLRAGVRSDRWSVSLYAKNVADSRGLSYVNPELGTAQFKAFYLTPRTVGVDLSIDF